ncbi:Ig-like domain repeat protein [Methanobrevibacter thaueri]|uniref:C1 family peptidase n=1 Tax=Methanobrevibacter thaueri TaxID=190975 RepID=UPI0026F1070E|nr:Ig-like domain repeat protein [Methanobrevibacter thaueri]
MKNYKIIALFSLLCLLILIPATYAMDNQTALEVSDEGNVTSAEYYFDANVENDTGDGSQDDPYRNLTSYRVKDNSIIYLNDGEYHLDSMINSRNLTVIGHNPLNTVITYNNNVGFAAVSSLTLRNLTLVSLAVSDDSSAVITAENVIFSDSTIGSVITTSNSRVYLDNCTFSNNHATSGGAININRGSLEIVDSLFMNNYAERYGGAIYLREANFIGKNVALINSTSIMGGAVTSVYTNLNLANVTSRNNHARYSGGAIYALFGSLSINNSIFINNSAKDGGALFVDEVNDFIPFNNSFTDNSAVSIAGAVYSAISRNLNHGSVLNESLMNLFFNNTASLENDVYECEAINLNYNSSQNYMIIRSGPEYDSDLPARYDLRQYYLVTPVKDQGSNGNCWAFASLASLESCILKATGAAYDLSEENMKDLMAKFSSYGWQMDTNTGGYDRMGHAYLTSWLGPVNETQDRYIIGEVLSPVLNSIFHVQNILFLERTSYTDNDEIKRAIMSYGAVSTSIHWYQSSDGADVYRNGKNIYWNRFDKGANHAVAIVGWDDNYSKNNFKTTPPGDGAWIIKNSWGLAYGSEEGYYYVSYYDTSLAPLNDPYNTYVFLFNESIKYDKNYQYDVSGRTDFFLNKSNTVWYKNVFTATDNELLSAVSTYFEKNTDWELSIYVNDVLRHVQSGTATPSYSTIELSSFIPLNLGDVFEVVFKITVDKEASVPISENIIASGVPINKQLFYENISFISYDGENWTDFYGLEWAYSSHSYATQVACIKAFTILSEVNTTTNLSVNVTDLYEIQAQVLNQYGLPVVGGNVTFSVNANDYVVPVVNGLATLKIPLSFNEYHILAVYDNVGYISSQDTLEFNASLINTRISLEINEHNPINITAHVVNDYGHAIKYGNVTFTIDDVPYTIGITNGTASLIKVLTIGKHNVSAVFNSVYSYNSSSTFRAFDVSFIDSNITLTIDNEYNPVVITANVTDQYGNPINMGNVTFIVDQTPYVVDVVNGIARLNYCFKNLGLNNVYVTFNGMENYYSTSDSSSNVTVKTTVLSSDATKTYNSKYSFTLLDNYGNPLDNRTVLVTIGSKNYEIITDKNGVGNVVITLSPAVYSVEITNPLNGEVKVQSIKVVKRITENKDLTVYYGAGKYFKVRVFDDDGNVAKNVKVTFTINNKKYTRTTDNNGYASFKVALNPAKYTITAEYKGFKVSNKIMVKSTIVTKNIKVKKGKTIKFTAKLLNNKGKILKYKKITFKFKGKTYKVKTNKKGIATLKITKKYKIGKYTITTSYGKLSVKNTVKIKK